MAKLTKKQKEANENLTKKVFITLTKQLDG